MSEELVLELKGLSGSVEERDGTWAVRSHDFGFTVYGESREEANEAFDVALEALVNSFGEDGLLRDFLRKKGVEFQFPEEPDRERKFERDVGVTFGASRRA
ncbi:MAG: hypothetical protein BZY87_10445 [SAR202 cluster bacterium Io17-Chloro-G6]|nr:MAG: hypothetical protein BZY87_10445 [SAR202 cluster bacterium Io17-Chloro-G6]